MSAGNTPAEARVQALSEIFERHVKFRIISEGLCLPDVPEAVIARYPGIAAGIRDLRAAGFGILVKDASLGGQYPVMNVTLLHPHDQGCFSSFGAHPRFEVALERALTELLQGRALDALAGFPEPGFDLDEIADAPNLEIHFVDSSGIISWEFLRDKPDFEFPTGISAPPRAEDYAWLCDAIHADGHDIYIADFDASRRLCLPHPGARHVGDLPDRRSGMGQQQRRQPAQSHPAPAATRRRRMRRSARNAQ
jgi:ribosomal protein S12 methylthiotransferase accessory factor